MTRPPDIDIEDNKIPDDCYFVAGKNLQQTVRYAKIPFGLVIRKVKHGRQVMKKTEGVLVFEADRSRMDTALEGRAFRQMRNGKTPDLQTK